MPGENQIMKKLIEENRHRLEYLENRLEQQEIEKRRNDIVIKAKNNFIRKELDMEIKIVNAHKVNDKTCVLEVRNLDKK